MTFIEPLDLETWIINVFSGNPDYFGAIAVLVITGMAGYFRMNGIGLFFMLGLFVLMFSGYIGLNFLIVFAIIGGLVIGYSISKMFR
jgi:uncharacterized protein (DUF58 family)